MERLARQCYAAAGDDAQGVPRDDDGTAGLGASRPAFRYPERARGGQRDLGREPSPPVPGQPLRTRSRRRDSHGGCARFGKARCHRLRRRPGDRRRVRCPAASRPDAGHAGRDQRFRAGHHRRNRSAGGRCRWLERRRARDARRDRRGRCRAVHRLPGRFGDKRALALPETGHTHPPHRQRPRRTRRELRDRGRDGRRCAARARGTRHGAGKASRPSGTGRGSSRQTGLGAETRRLRAARGIRRTADPPGAGHRDARAAA